MVLIYLEIEVNVTAFKYISIINWINIDSIAKHGKL